MGNGAAHSPGFLSVGGTPGVGDNKAYLQASRWSEVALSPLRKTFFWYGEVWGTVRSRVDRITQGFCVTPACPALKIGDQQLFVVLRREIGTINVDVPVTLGRLLVFL